MSQRVGRGQTCDYQEVLEAALESKKERPKFLARQLQVAGLMADSLVRHFSAATNLIGQLHVHRYGQKLRTVYSNNH